MSEISIAAPGGSVAEETPPGFVCCSSDGCATLPNASLPWFRIVFGLFVALQTMMLGLTVNLTAPDERSTLLLLQGGMLAATLVVVALLGVPLAADAIRSLRQRRLTMELLFLAGISAALAISIGSMLRGDGPVYFEVVSILLVIYSVGRLVTGQSRDRALVASQRMLQQVALARRVDGTQVPAAEVRPGDCLRILPGELIPADGLIIEGQSLVRTTAFSGEWKAGVKHPGETVLAGTACEDGTLLVEATASGSDRRIDHLAKLIVSACQASSPMQRMADAFVHRFLPAVALIALATLIYWGMTHSWQAGLFNALAVVLVACPCAAGLATPLATWTAITRLADRGLLLKSADALQRLATAQRVIFDKTGTLSDASLQLLSLKTGPDSRQRQSAIAILAAIEKHSDHPVARVLRNLPQDSHLNPPAVGAVRTLPGLGIEADITLDGRAATVRLVRRPEDEDLTMDASIDGAWFASATFSERLRQSARSAVQRLEAMGLPVEIMTGDCSSAVKHAQALAPTTAAMTPEAKHAATRSAGARVLFVGDGINDAAAMGASHCSIAMASGAAITVETADATLHSADLSAIPDAIALARQTLATIRHCFLWAVVYNLIGMALAAVGWLHPLVAALLMSVSSGVVAWKAGRSTIAEPPVSISAFPGPGSHATALRAAPSSAGKSRLLPLLCLHLLAFVGQGLILIPLAQLDRAQSLTLIFACTLAGLLTMRFASRMPAWLEMTVAMLSVGGLGMTFGWWLDLHFDPAVQNGSIMACCMARKVLETTGAQSTTHWMYWLMLLAGVPAMFLLRQTPIAFAWRKWCCSGMLLIGTPAMCFGMWAGAQLAMRLPIDAGWGKVLASWAFMMLGMSAGMLLPHSLELAFVRRQPAV